MNKSTKILLILVLILSILTAINVFLPQGELLGQFEFPAPKPILAIATFFIIFGIYGTLGFIGLKLSKKLGFARIWDRKISNKQRFLIPAIIGAIIGVFFIIVDLIFNKFHTLGALPHPPFPTSLTASITAGIGEEMIFRLFLLSFWVWLISYVILKKKWQNQIFWIVAIFSAVAFAFMHLPSIMIILNLNFSQIPPVFIAELILLNGVLSLFAAGYLRKYGLLAAIGIHFWADIVWHVIYGVL